MIWCTINAFITCFWIKQDWVLFFFYTMWRLEGLTHQPIRLMMIKSTKTKKMIWDLRFLFMWFPQPQSMQGSTKRVYTKEYTTCNFLNHKPGTVLIHSWVSTGFSPTLSLSRHDVIIYSVTKTITGSLWILTQSQWSEPATLAEAYTGCESSWSTDAPDADCCGKEC